MVNTKTTLSKKVLAVVLAVACMVAFTPAIAFTQSANASSGLVKAGTVTIDGITTAEGFTKAFSGTATGENGTTVTVENKTVTLNQSSPIEATKITVAEGYTFVVKTNGYTLTSPIEETTSANLTVSGAGKIVGTITTGTTGTTAINDTATVAPTTGTAIDADAVTTGTVTVASGATVKAGTVAADTAGAAAITFPVGTTTTAGTLTVNGTVTGGDGNPKAGVSSDEKAGGNAIMFSTATTKALTYAKYTATGATLAGGYAYKTDASSNPVKGAQATPTNITDQNIQGTVAIQMNTDNIGVGTRLTAMPTGITTPAYTWYASTDAVLDSKDTKVGSSQDYTVAKTDAGKYIILKATDGTKDGYAMKVTTKVPAAAVAPKFTTQPKSQSLNLGDTMTDLNAVATSSSGTPTYKWYATTGTTAANGTEITSANYATYNVKTAPTAGALDLSDTAITSSTQLYNYYCVATVTSGTDTASTTSDLATCTSTAFSVKTQPVSASYYQGDALKDLTVAVNGNLASGQWYLATKADLSDGAPISSETTLTLAGTNLATAINSATKTGTYYVYFKASKNSVDIQSTAATITINAASVKTQPKGTEYAVGDTLTTSDNMTVALNGTPASATYQWYKNDVNSAKGGAEITGEITSTLGHTKISTATEGTTYYYCVISYNDGTTAKTLTTTPAAVKIVKRVYLSGPKDLTVAVGETTATVSIHTNGTSDTFSSVQWYYNTTKSTEGAVACDGTGKTDPSMDVLTNSTAASGKLDTSKAGNVGYYFAKYKVNSTDEETTSPIATVKVADFAITAQPANKTVAVGQDAYLTTKSNIDGSLVSWFKSTTATAPTTAAELNIMMNAGVVTAVSESVSLDGSSSYKADTSAVGTSYYFAVFNYGGTDNGFTQMATVTVTPKAKNAKFTSSSLKYVVTTATVTGGNVHVYAPKSTKYKSVTVPATVKVGDFTYKVTGINSKSFAKAKKLKTVTIKTTTLTKSGVKNCFKGSKVKTVKVPKAKYKAYKKIFTKKNCGKTVKVKKY